MSVYVVTPPQLTELQRLAKEPQLTYGSARSRIQNTLVYRGWATYDLGGQFCLCRITEAGKVALAHEIEKRSKTSRKAKT